MRLLWIKYGELLPPDTGGKLRSYHLLRKLAERIDLKLLSYVPENTPTSYDVQLRKAFPNALVVREHSLGGVPARAVWSSAVHGIPLTTSRFTSPRVRAAVTAEVADGCDVVLCDFLAPGECVPASLQVPTVLFEHNVEAALWARRAKTVSGLKEMLYTWEANAVAKYERRMLDRFDLTLCVSEADRLSLQKMAPNAKVIVLETGVDLAEFARPHGIERDPRLVVFVGSMDWQPNVVGIQWFMAEIWPKVIVKVPDAKFRIVGRRPPPAIQAFASESVEITGDVESVVPHLHAAAVTVVPLLSGGGTRLKIYEAMAAGAPVVSTTVGAEGLPVIAGKDLELDDTSESMATTVIRTLLDQQYGSELAEHALRTVASHDWSGVAGELELHLRSLLPSARARM